MIENFQLIIFITFIFGVFIIVGFNFFFSRGSGNKERLKILLERQDNLQKNIVELIENNINKIDLKVEKSNSQQTNNINFIREKISLIDNAQNNISSLSENVISLTNILSNTSKRGRFGEILLENLIKDYLPTAHFEFQKTLSNNTRVDCIIKSPGPLGALCIDAKFPREGFEKIINSTNKQEKEISLKSFKNDILKHIDDVSKKYIIPGETSEIALIFIPSESIFIEIFRYFPDISRVFYDKKTFLISPTTLCVILTSIESLLKDRKIKENADVIQYQLNQLTNELQRLEIRVKKLDSHFSNAQNDLNDILITTKKITGKTNSILNLDIKN